jgi:hypothetical protein
MALFFWNQADGAELGIVWKPKTFLSRSFSILESQHRMIVMATPDVRSDKDQRPDHIVNISEVIAEMLKMCNGVVTDVILN